MKFSLFKTANESLARFHEPEVQVRFANLYWPLLLVLGSITALLGLLCGVWFFFSEEEAVPPTVLPSASGLKPEDLRALVEGLEERQRNFQNLK